MLCRPFFFLAVFAAAMLSRFRSCTSRTAHVGILSPALSFSLYRLPASHNTRESLRDFTCKTDHKTLSNILFGDVLQKARQYQSTVIASSFGRCFLSRSLSFTSHFSVYSGFLFYLSQFSNTVMSSSQWRCSLICQAVVCFQTILYRY